MVSMTVKNNNNTHVTVSAGGVCVCESFIKVLAEHYAPPKYSSR